MEVRASEGGREDVVDRSSSSSNTGSEISAAFGSSLSRAFGVPEPPPPPVSLSSARRRDSSFSLSLGSNFRRE